MQLRNGLIDSSHLVNDPVLYSVLPHQDRSHILGQDPGLCHQFLIDLLICPAMIADKACDPVLDQLEIFEGLGNADHSPIHPHRMDHHGAAWNNKRIVSGHCQRHTDGVGPSQNQ